MSGILVDELERVVGAAEPRSEGFSVLLASAARKDARNALARELWRLRWDRRKLKGLHELRDLETAAFVRNARANLEYYLVQEPPISSHNYYMHAEPLAALRCGCGKGQGMCQLHAALLARS